MVQRRKYRSRKMSLQDERRNRITETNREWRGDSGWRVSDFQSEYTIVQQEAVIAHCNVTTQAR